MNIEDAQVIIIQWVKDGAKTEYSNYGYDIYIPNVIRSLLAKDGVNAEREGQVRKHELSPFFMLLLGNFAGEASSDQA